MVNEMLITLFLFTKIALADPEAITLEKGSTAPFSGTLMNKEAIAQILASVEEQKQRCKIEKEKEIAIVKEDLQSEIDSAASDVETCESFAEELRADNEMIIKKYNHSISMRPLIAGVGFVGGVGLTILIASALGSAL